MRPERAGLGRTMSAPNGPPPDRRGSESVAVPSWTAEVRNTLLVSRRLAWRVAFAAAVVAGLEAVALLSLAPLKAIAPYTIVVDRKTGYAEVVGGRQTEPLPPNATGVRGFLARYVLAREGSGPFDTTDLVGQVVRWSALAERARYLEALRLAKPVSAHFGSPDAREISVTVKTVTIIGSGAARVGFSTERREAGGAGGDQEDHVAEIAFRRLTAPRKGVDPLLDPAGLQVTAYVRRELVRTLESPPLRLPDFARELP